MSRVRNDNAESPSTSTAPARPERLCACHECRRKKTKRDMARPICGLCRRTGHECQFPTKRKRPSSIRKLQRPAPEAAQDELDWLLSMVGSRDARHLLRSHLKAQTSPPTSSNEAFAVDGASAGSASSLDLFADRLSGDGPESLDVQHPTPSPREVEQADYAPSPEPSTGNIPVTHGQDADGSRAHAVVPFDLAIDLIATFSRHIQPWLPLLHKPRFMSSCAQLLNQSGPDALAGLPADMELLLYSLFALSSRHSHSTLFKDVEPRERAAAFREAARQSYSVARSIETPTLTDVQRLHSTCVRR